MAMNKLNTLLSLDLSVPDHTGLFTRHHLTLLVFFFKMLTQSLYWHRKIITRKPIELLPHMKGIDHIYDVICRNPFCVRTITLFSDDHDNDNDGEATLVKSRDDVSQPLRPSRLFRKQVGICILFSQRGLGRIVQVRNGASVICFQYKIETAPRLRCKWCTGCFVKATIIFWIEWVSFIRHLRSYDN